MFVIGTFGLNFQLTAALMAKQVFHRTAAGYGWLSTALAVGAFIGAINATRRVRRPSQLFLVTMAVTFGALEIVTGLMPSFGSTALLLVPTGFAMLTFSTAANSSVQLGVDPTMRGRVMALYIVCFMGGTPLGAPIVGWVAGAFGPRWGLIGGGLVCVLAAVATAAVLARRRGMSGADVGQRIVTAWR